MNDLDAIRARDAATYDMPLHFGAEVIAALDEALDDRRALLAEVDRLRWEAAHHVCPFPLDGAQAGALAERARIRSSIVNAMLRAGVDTPTATTILAVFDEAEE